MNDYIVQLQSKLQAMPPERRQKTLDELASKLLVGGQIDRLVQLAYMHGWFELQHNHDPSYRGYVATLDRAIQAIDNEQTDLADAMVIALLRATMQSLLTNVPLDSVEAMTQSGAIEQARYYASQRPEPSERVDAYIAIARMQQGSAQHYGAIDTLKCARAQALTIRTLDQQLRALQNIVQVLIDLRESRIAVETLTEARLAMSRIENVTNRLWWQMNVEALTWSATGDRSSFISALAQMLIDAQSLTNARDKSHFLGCIAEIAQTHNSHDIWQRAVLDLRAVYSSISLESPSDLASRPWAYPVSSRRNVDLQDIAIFVRNFGLLDQPIYLVTLACWDWRQQATDWEEHQKTNNKASLQFAWSPHRWKSHDLAAVIIRAATHSGDHTTCRRIVDTFVEHLADSPATGDGVAQVDENFIEALAETGFCDTAIECVARDLPRQDADFRYEWSLLLRKALARGAGRRGDFAAVFRATEAIRAIAPQQNRDKLVDRIRAGVNKVTKRVTSDLFEPAETEPAGVLAAGYEGLAAGHPDELPGYLQQLHEKFGLHIHDKVLEIVRWKQEDSNVEIGSDREASLMLSMTGIVRKMSQFWGAFPLGDSQRGELTSILKDLDEGEDAALKYRLLQQLQQEQIGVDEAINLARQIQDVNDRLPCLIRIAQVLIVNGDYQRAIELANDIPMAEQQQLFLATIADSGCKIRPEKLRETAEKYAEEKMELAPDDTLARSGAFHGLVRSLDCRMTIDDLLKLINPLGTEAILGCLSAFSTTVAITRDAAMAERVIDLAQRHERSWAQLQALSTMAQEWAPVFELRSQAQRALSAGVKQYQRSQTQRLNLWYSDILNHERYQKSPLPLAQLSMARAARSLNDRTTMQYLFKHMTTNDMNESHFYDSTLVELVVGLSPINQTISESDDADKILETFNFIGANEYRALAIARLAFDLEVRPPEHIYHPTLGETLDATGDYLSSSFLKVVSSDERPQKNTFLSWKDYRYSDAKDIRDRWCSRLLEKAVETMCISTPRKRGWSALSGMQLNPKPAAVAFFTLLLEHGAKHLVEKCFAETKPSLPMSLLMPQPDKTSADVNLIGMAAIEAAAEAGDFRLAQDLVAILPGKKEQAMAQIYLSVWLAPHQAPDRLMKLLGNEWSEDTIATVTAAVRHLPDNLGSRTAKKRLALQILRLARLHGRGSVLKAIDMLLPLATNLIEREQWLQTVLRIIETETWWMTKRPNAA